MSLILHCGANNVPRHELYAQPAPEKRGPRHQPMHHADFIEQPDKAAGPTAAYAIQEEAFGLSHNGNRLFGLYQVEHENLPAVLDGTGGFTVGFRGSHDMSFPRGICGGTRVFVCDNLGFSGELLVKSKQTLNLEHRLPVLMEHWVRELAERFGYMGKMVDAYRSTKITDETAAHAIIEMARRNIVNWGELGKVTEEWYSPAHEEHAEGGKNVYRLWNAATENLKPRNPEHPRLPNLMGSVDNDREGKGPRLQQLMDEVALAA